MKFLLSVIAICLVMITGKLYIPQAQADIDDVYFIQSKDFVRSVKDIVEKDCYWVQFKDKPYKDDFTRPTHYMNCDKRDRY